MSSGTIYTGEQWGHLHWEAGAIYVGPFTQVSNGAVYTGELGLFTLVSSGAVYTGELGLFTLVSSGAVYTGELGLFTLVSSGAVYTGELGLFTLVSSGAVYTDELGLFTLVSSGAVYTGEDVCADPGLGMRHCLYTRLSGWDRCQPRSALFCSMPEHSSHLFHCAPSDLILQVQQLWKQVICKTCPVCVEQ